MIQSLAEGVLRCCPGEGRTFTRAFVECFAEGVRNLFKALRTVLASTQNHPDLSVLS